MKIAAVITAHNEGEEVSGTLTGCTNPQDGLNATYVFEYAGTDSWTLVSYGTGDSGATLEFNLGVFTFATTGGSHTYAPFTTNEDAEGTYEFYDGAPEYQQTDIVFSVV